MYETKLLSPFQNRLRCKRSSKRKPMILFEQPMILFEQPLELAKMVAFK
jgi:hypothetical protein